MKSVILLFSILTFLLQQVKAQGCSDAGFCTMGALQPNQFSDTTGKNKFKLSMVYGKGEQGTSIFQTIPEFEHMLFRNNLIQLKVPYYFINGNLGKTNGIGDISLSINQTLINTDKLKFDVTIGTKIATGKSDAMVNDRPLPMPYQTSLGTNDLILGAALQYEKWKLGVGFQGVLSNGNENQFLRIKWMDHLDGQKYFESRLLQRGSDALVRLERSFVLKKVNLSPALLAIYHLQKSSILNEAGHRVDVKSSDGITLNMTGNAQFNFSTHTGINLSVGFPVVTRKERPDGLTRHFVLAVTFNYRFGSWL